MNQQRSCDGIGLGDFGLTREELLVPNTRAKMNRVVSCTMGDLINRGKVARQVSKCRRRPSTDPTHLNSHVLWARDYLKSTRACLMHYI